MDTEIEWYAIELLNGYYAYTQPRYMKDSTGWVHVAGTFSRNTAPISNESILYLPEGFRPTDSVPILFLQHIDSTGNNPWATYGWAGRSGNVRFTEGAMPSNFRPNAAIVISFHFKAIP